MPSRLIPATLLVTSLMASLPALAGDCRQLLHPLLLEATPDQVELERVRSICTAESNAGDADSTYELALFSLGLAGNWQPDVAIPLIRSAAAQDVSEAQYWLAWQSATGPPQQPAPALQPARTTPLSQA